MKVQRVIYLTIEAEIDEYEMTTEEAMEEIDQAFYQGVDKMAQWSEVIYPEVSWNFEYSEE